MFLLYLPVGSLFETLLASVSKLIKFTFPQLMMDDLIECPNEEEFIRCVRAMGIKVEDPDSQGLVTARNPVEEERVRGQFIAALNMYAMSLNLASMFATNANDKAKIAANIRMVQFLLSKLYDPGEWAQIADAVWGLN